MTVKELAKECNVHYNTMRKWLFDNNVKKENNALNGRYLITSTVITKAKKHFLKENIDPDKNDMNIDNLLIQQLLQKDTQIVEQQKQIDHLQRLLENQQILTLKAQEQVFLLEKNNQEKTQKNKWRFWK